jgi:hypothetical protein
MESVTVAVAKSSPPIARSIEQVAVRVALLRADLALDQDDVDQPHAVDLGVERPVQPFIDGAL